ncbi:MAG: AsmA family protein [Candidatus Omnitrophica bacterium]|nr:AsmA family protein [Candidatus Omnitrophota bacterium]
MKKIKIALIVIAAILSLLFIGMIIFFRTFDLNRYTSQITAEAQKVLGREVRMGSANLGFSFSRGFMAIFKDIVIAEDPQFSSTEPFLSITNVSFGVDLKQILLERKLVVADITVDSPSIRILRNKDGRINAMSLGLTSSAPTTPEKKGETVSPSGSASGTREADNGVAVLPVFLIKNVMIKGGTVAYIDEMVDPKMGIELTKMDVAIKDLSMTDPFTVSAKAALFSDEQDLRLDLRIALQLRNFGARLEDMVLAADLSKISPDKLAVSLPMMKPLALQSLKGDAAVSIKSLEVNILGVQGLQAELTLDKGYLLTGLFPVPLENMTIKIAADRKQADIQNAVVSLAGGSIRIKGAVKDYLKTPSADLSLEMVDVNPAKISEAYKVPVKVQGRAQGNATLSFSGKTPEEIARSLKAKTEMEVLDGTLEGINLIETGIANIPMLPGLWDSVKNDLPQETQDDLKKGSTPIQSCVATASVGDAVITIEKAELVTRDMAFSATGVAPFISDMVVEANIFISPKISEILVRKTPDLSALVESDSRIRIPVRISGPLSAPKIKPNTSYLTRKVVAERSKKELEKVLGKNSEVGNVLKALLGGKASPAAPAAGDSSTTADTQGQTDAQGQPSTQPQPDAQGQTDSSAAVGDLLNSLLKKK